MTYFPDLSRFTYQGLNSNSVSGLMFDTQNTVNIGWLGEGQPFPTGETSSEFKERLLEFCFYDHAFNKTRGNHSCELPECPIEAGIMGKTPAPLKRGEQTAWFGSHEIRVVGSSRVYAAPTMIYHYVTDHNYLPPEEFIQAVLTGPGPGTDSYWEQYRRLEKAS